LVDKKFLNFKLKFGLVNYFTKKKLKFIKKSKSNLTEYKKLISFILEFIHQTKTNFKGVENIKLVLVW